MPQPPLEWAELSARLDHLLTLPPLERERELEALAANDPASGARLRELLGKRNAASAQGFLAGVAEPRLMPQESSAGTVLGAWTLREPIGEGGMGSVWRATRSDGRFAGEAAIKVLKGGGFDVVANERFRREGAILARLEHPGIARLFDAGITDRGAPYLVLELVRGAPIDRHCDERRLSVRARVEIFLQVLDAVAAAHAQLVIHRDLKPSNILVDESGRVRLLDFGIAHLLPDRDGAPIALTREGSFALTPPYAAPEQADGSAALSTATDVYALGVVLHELLAGAHPSGLIDASPLAYVRAATEGHGARASARARQPAAASPTPWQRAEARGTTPQALERQLRGDLDNIVARALEPKAADRYATVPALADDLRRYLNHEPVSARRGAWSYRAAKFLRRHRVGSAAAAALALAVLGGVVGTSWQAAKAQRERDRALSEARRNASLVEFFRSMLTQAAQDERPITVSALVERSRALATQPDGAMPDTDAAVLVMLATITVTLGDSASGDKLLADAQARLDKARDGGTPAQRAEVACHHAYVASKRGRADEARERFAQAMPLIADDPAAQAMCLVLRAYVAQNHNDAKGALDDAQAALDLMRRSGAAPPTDEAIAIGNVAIGHFMLGHAAQADAGFAQAIERMRALGRGDTPVVVTFLNNWGLASSAAGDVVRAQKVYEEAGAIAKRLAPERALSFTLQRNRALVQLEMAQYDTAIAGLEQARKTAQADGNVPEAVTAELGIAMAQLERGDIAAAKALVDQTRTRLSTLPANSFQAVGLMRFDARLALAEGRWGDAREGFGTVIDFFDSRGMQVWPVVSALRMRAQARLKEGTFDEAAADLDRALTIARKLQADKPYSSHTGRTLAAMVELHRARGQHDEARGVAAQAAEHLGRALGPEHPETLLAREAAAR
jgi:serine/threonine protein kinase